MDVTEMDNLERWLLAGLGFGVRSRGWFRERDGVGIDRGLLAQSEQRIAQFGRRLAEGIDIPEVVCNRGCLEGNGSIADIVVDDLDKISVTST